MFPYIEISGTHRKIGQAIGEMLRGEIQKALNMHFKRFHALEKKLHPKAAGTLTHTVQKYFPDFVEEVKGIAEGANQPLEQLLFFSFEEELSPSEHCTTLAIKAKKTIYFAHNEDYDLGLPLYIIKAKPKGKPEFISVGQAGQFPGLIGFNDRGFVFAGNSIATKTNFKGLPKTYCLRSFLECEKISDAVAVIEQKERAIGNNSILVSAKEGRIVSLEWSPEEFNVEETVGGIAHANHFLTEKMSSHQSKKTSKSSLNRYLHVQENVLKMNNPSLSNIKKIMRTHLNSKYSICQHKGDVTLASVIIDTAEKKMMVSSGNPCKQPYKVFSI